MSYQIHQNHLSAEEGIELSESVSKLFILTKSLGVIHKSGKGKVVMESVEKMNFTTDAETKDIDVVVVYYLEKTKDDQWIRTSDLPQTAIFHPSRLSEASSYFLEILSSSTPDEVMGGMDVEEILKLVGPSK